MPDRVPRLTLALLALAIGCDARESAGGRTQADSSAAAPEAADVQAEERAIRALRDAQERAVAAKDTAGVLSVYADDVVYLPGGGPPGEGSDAVRALWVNGLSAPVTIAYTPTALDVTRSGDLAVERGTVKITRGGRAEEQGNYVYVWKKRAGRWQVTLWSFATQDVKGSAAGRR